MSTQTPRSPQAGKPAGKPATTKPIPGQPNGPGSWQRGRWVLLLLAVVCAAPIAISYFVYYVVKPAGGSTNYGTLIQPQRPIPDALTVTGEDGKPLKLASLRGHWLMISVDGSECDKACVTKLYFMRQIRAAQGPERERVVEVWLRTDAGKVADVIQTAYPDTNILIADPAQVAAWLPADTGTRDTDHIYLVDPNGNLMMRFPKDANPSKIKSDLTKLLKWSRIG
ncbi:cytochrome C oxidase subunit I [Paraburkholderia sp. MMS20-SJTR3]|uniref:Cytochrome C oxidase subunit I n=1 Tax=Paraburkholderia sejongensis TaxID=2886946 RepID=A0ABS8JQ93_9BURK|nr:cytochrome C oxidase subunit I [Paraburkholderia sp. MMS20-SJTR3]MCC8392084.1 cytochrome C oxidase subunit I [Paraburkholderia sp. MMS20-SJTR3]